MLVKSWHLLCIAANVIIKLKKKQLVSPKVAKFSNNKKLAECYGSKKKKEVKAKCCIG